MNNLIKCISRCVIFVSLVLGLSALIISCSSGKKENQVPAKAVPVTVATAIQRDVPVQVHAIGNAEAYSTVSVKPQIGGELSRVYFKGGQYVKKGAMLFLIDPRPYEAALRQAEANLVRDTVQAENASVDAQRYAELFKKGYVAREQYDQMRTNADALEAVVKADKAAVENARLQLGYCYIRNPIDGLTGSLIVNQGNIVKANPDTAIVVINQIIPIYVDFSVPEEELPDIKRYMAAGKLKVEAVIPNTETKVGGELTFIDNTVNTATGTIMLKATFPNKDRTLWPGQFVDVVLTLTTQPNAVVVPSQAVQTGQAGSYVFIVKPDLTVELRQVASGRTYDREVVIEKGIQTGEKVVTDGQLQLLPGTKVEIKKAGMPESSVR